MKKKQLTPTDIAARAERVYAIPSVVPLAGASESDLVYYLHLTDVKLRSVCEPEWGIYLAESSKVVRRALEAGHQPVSFLMSEKWADDLSDVLQAHPRIPAYVGSEEALEKITGFHLHRGALAVMKRPAPVPLSRLLDGTYRVAILEDIVDHTNVGAIFRSAAALEVDAVLVTPRCADPLYRRSIRVSMGAVFQIPWGRVDTWPDALDTLHALNYETAALALANNSFSIGKLAERRDEKLALILGSEGYGISRGALAKSRHTVTIPMSNGVDSLNVAAASAVAFWETRPR